MSWIETGRLSLPKDTVVAQGHFHQGGYFFRTVPRWKHKTHLFCWDGTHKQEQWKVEISERCVFLGSVGSSLLLRDAPLSGVSPRRATLYAMNPKDGARLWSTQSLLRAFSVANDRIYAIERPRQKPLRQVSYSGDSGKAMRAEMAFAAFQELWATDEMLIEREGDLWYALDLAGELIDEIKLPANLLCNLRSVGPDGSVYYYEQDPKEGHCLHRWRPKAKELWSTSTGEFGVYRVLASREPGVMLYSQRSKRSTKTRFILYDWEKDHARWDVEVDLGYSGPNAQLSESPVGFFVLVENYGGFFFEPKTGAAKGIPHAGSLSHSWIGERLFLQQKQNLIALAWKS